ncbi:hypothetical protein O0L34_g11910 [Tuta absoluta]|nr:hypothetical protein O0L34_g11910 [Tuta absoluta]
MTSIGSTSVPSTSGLIIDTISSAAEFPNSTSNSVESENEIKIGHATQIHNVQSNDSMVDNITYRKREIVVVNVSVNNSFDALADSIDSDDEEEESEFSNSPDLEKITHSHKFGRKAS